MVSNKKPCEPTEWGWTYHDPPRDRPSPNRTSLNPVGSFPAGWQRLSEPPALSSPHRNTPKPSPNPSQSEPPSTSPIPIRIRPARTRPDARRSGRAAGRGAWKPFRCPVVNRPVREHHPPPEPTRPPAVMCPRSFCFHAGACCLVRFFPFVRLRITYTGFVLAVPDCQAVASIFLT